jgi:hypothetical protein
MYAKHVSDQSVFSSNACTQGLRTGVQRLHASTGPHQHASTVHLPNTGPDNGKRKRSSVDPTAVSDKHEVICSAAKKRHAAEAAEAAVSTRGSKAAKAAKANTKSQGHKKQTAKTVTAVTTEPAAQQQVRTFFNNVVYIVLIVCLLSWFEAERICYYSFAKCNGSPQFTVMGWFCQERSPTDSLVGEHELPLDSVVEPPVTSLCMESSWVYLCVWRLVVKKSAYAQPHARSMMSLNTGCCETLILVVVKS